MAKSNCISCGKEVKYNPSSQTGKYCNNKCQQDYQWQQKKLLIEAGEVALYSKAYKRYLIETLGEKCQRCGWSEINPTSNTIPIELEHIDGNSQNNSLDNLTLLCPNCHSLTPTYKALNVGNGRHARRNRYKEGKSY